MRIYHLSLRLTTSVKNRRNREIRNPLKIKHPSIKKKLLTKRYSQMKREHSSKRKILTNFRKKYSTKRKLRNYKKKTRSNEE